MISLANGESYRDFRRAFPDETAAMNLLCERRSGPRCRYCGGIVRLYRPHAKGNYRTRCCWHQVYPRAGCFAGSSNIALRTWFQALLLVSNTNAMASAGFLRRHLGLSDLATQGVAKWIRIHQAALATADWRPMSGTVYVDEMLLTAVTDEHARIAPPVSLFGIAGDQGVRLFCVPDRKARTLIPIIREHVASGSKVVADGFAAYDRLADFGYIPSRVNHSRREWKNAAGDTTAPIETCWRAVRYKIEGVHCHVADRHLWSYLGQQMFVMNARRNGESPFWRSLETFPPVRTMQAELRARIDRRPMEAG